MGGLRLDANILYADNCFTNFTHIAIVGKGLTLSTPMNNEQ